MTAKFYAESPWALGFGNKSLFLKTVTCTRWLPDTQNLMPENLQNGADFPRTYDGMQQPSESVQMMTLG